ncbi:MAG: P-loop NTPase [Planctomycetaceae bacterium]|nr:P-loop NTPase [Planctomycetales bacterium]MCB9924804.1 P-loop NTPase [Planctomycetaceae bacterium]
MIDQATELRKLVLRAMRAQPIATGPPPRLLALTGGADGVGVTTIAVNLAVAMAEQGLRVVIVDADADRSDVATLCGVLDKTQDTKPIGSQGDIHEVLYPGPAGIQIVPGLRTSGLDASATNRISLHNNGLNEIAYERFRRQLSSLGRHVDTVIVDLGSGAGDFIRRFTATADEVLLVTATEDAAVMDAYTRIKTGLSLSTERRLRLVVNREIDEANALDVHRRIDGSCRKFLGTTIEFGGHLPHDAAVTRGARDSRPFVLIDPVAPASRALTKLARALAPQLHQANTA